MHDQPRIEPLEAHPFFADGMGARRPPAGTVARGQLFADRHLHAGKDESGEFVDSLPKSIALDRALLLHGRERFEIYCSPCHDSTGGGRGMIVRRGFKQPRPYWEPRLVDMPLGYFFDVMTQGYGVMSSYAKQVPVEDRWAIAAWVRVLQASRTRRLEDLPADVQTEFRNALAAAPEEEAPSGH
jgi:mono/diheme cytochrome c family protein